MISLTFVSDLLSPRHAGNRELLEADYQGTRIADYLPDECLDDEARRLLWVSHNGRRVPCEEWDDSIIRDGDHIGCTIPPTGVAEAVFLVATVIVSAWQAYDATRRAKIRQHHAARRAAAFASHMGDSPTYGWGGITNTVNPGGPRQVLLGRHRVGGQFLMGWPQGDGTIDLMLGISEGEVEGLESGSVEINGKPQNKYPGMVVASRTGTIAQTGVGIYGGGSLVTPQNTVSLLASPTGNNAGSYYWGSGTRWAGTGTAIGNGSLAPLSQTKPTGNGVSPTKGTIDGYQVGMSANLKIQVFNRNAHGYVQFHVDVEHRTPQGSGTFVSAGTAISGVARVLNGVLTSVVAWTFRSAFLPLAPYDVRVTLNTSTSVLIADDGQPVSFHNNLSIILQFLLEYRNFDRRNPGLAFLGIEGLSSGAVGGVLPTVTSIWEGRKIADITSVGPPAVFSSEAYRTTNPTGYTRGENPALVILDLLRSLRYGPGEFVDPDKDLDLQSFVDARDFCDRLVSRGQDAFDPVATGTDGVSTGSDILSSASVDFVAAGVRVDDTCIIAGGANAGTYRVGAVAAGQINLTSATPPFSNSTLSAATGQTFTINNTERACKTDYYLDGFTTFWKVVESIAQPARLSLVRSNGKIKLIPDENGSVVQVFGMGNLDKFKSERTGEIVANRIEVQYLDERKNWEQAVAAFEDDLVRSSTKAVDLVRTQIEAFGVTRRTQATRIAKYHWLSNRLERETITFEADATALTIEWGDVIQVMHDALPKDGLITGADGEKHNRFPSGRIKSVSGNVVILDDFHTWAVVGGYNRFMVQRRDTDALEFIGTVPTSLDLLPTDRIDFGGFGAYTPVAGDIFVTEASFVDTPQPTLYKVTAITRTEEHRRQITAVTYNQDLYLDNATAGTTGADTIELSEIDP